MFEVIEVAADDAVSCADALVASLAEIRRAGAHRLALVARWADVNDPDKRTVRAMPREERVRRASVCEIGGDGTPAVSLLAITELGMLLQTSTSSAEALLRDVVDLRHRLPEVWGAVLTGRVEDWKAREVARATRSLTYEAARTVDPQILEALLGLSWGRAKAVVEGRVIAADPAAHQARLAEEENKRFVSTRRRSDAAGLRTLIARGPAGDIARLEAMIAHLAALMAGAGDTDPVDTRRAKALAMLANPALTCVYLTHAHDAIQPSDTDTATGTAIATDTGMATDGGTDTDTDGAGAPVPEQDPAHRAVDAVVPFDVETRAEAAEPMSSDPEPDPAADPERDPDADPDPQHPSPVELAVTFGRMLASLGTRALDRLRPRSVLYLHLSAEAIQNAIGAGVVRVEDPIAGGPIGVAQLREWLANDRITVRPVFDPAGAEPVDGYEVPVHLREASELLSPYEVFPYGTLSARQADQDHTKPYVPLDEGGPPGQTALDNLGPLGRRHHLAKTFAGFEVHQPLQGIYLWRTPTGHWYQVDHRGTSYAGKQRPAVLETAESLDSTGMSPLEERFRTALLRNRAA